MRIHSIESFTRGHLCFVRVRSDDGAMGLGQIAPYHANIAAMVLHEQIAPHALGAPIDDLQSLTDCCFEANHKYPWSYVARATGGLDTALWDLRGRQAGQCVCQLLGGQPRPVPVYGSSQSRDTTPQQEARRMVGLRDAHGYRAFKVRVGKVCGHNADQWPGRSEMLVPTVRQALGDEVRLLVDANSCYTPDRAIEVGRWLEGLGVHFFEEPCPYWELEWTAQVADALDLPVAGGEQDNDLAQWRRMIRMRAIDIVQPDVCYVGGFTRALQVADLARQAGLPLVPHSANLTMVTVFALHLIAAVGDQRSLLEYSIEQLDWVRDLFSPSLVVRDGHVQVPSGPGWGVTIQPAWLAAAEYRVSRLADR